MNNNGPNHLTNVVVEDPKNNIKDKGQQSVTHESSLSRQLQVILQGQQTLSEKLNMQEEMYSDLRKLREQEFERMTLDPLFLRLMNLIVEFDRQIRFSYEKMRCVSKKIFDREQVRGFRSTLKNMKQMLESLLEDYGVEKIIIEKRFFDPKKMQCESRQVTYLAGLHQRVVKVFRPGYTRNGDVLVKSKVSILVYKPKDDVKLK